MTAPVCCFTSLSYGDLPQARVMAETLRAAHPDWAVHAVLVDQLPDGVEAAPALDGFDEVMPAEQLEIPRFRSWLFKHGQAEACAAVKGAMLVALLARGFEWVVYLDPAMAVFHPLSTMLAGSLVLMPRQTAPTGDEAAALDDELSSLQRGVYDPSFLAVRNDDVGRAFASWWSGRLQAGCYEDVPNGMFRDQRYCDLVPGLFDGVRVERDAGCGVAGWNLNRRSVRFAAGSVTVNGSPLKLYNFAGQSDPDMLTERYAGDGLEAIELWHWYKRQLSVKVPGLQDGGWGYGRFSNGEPIPRALRLIYRDRPDLVASIDDPFDAATGMLAWAAMEGLDLKS